MKTVIFGLFTFLVADLIVPSFGSLFVCTDDTRRRNRHLAASDNNDHWMSNRYLASNEDLWMSEEIKHCLDESYDSGIIIKYGHLFFAAIPQNSLDCPIILSDDGIDGESEEDWEYSTPHVTIVGGEDEKEEFLNEEHLLIIDHSITLDTFFDAIKDLSSSRGIANSDYDMIDNNCATHILNVFKKIGLDYKEAATFHMLETHVGRSLAAYQDTINKIHAAYLKKNTGLFQKTKFGVWNWYVGDEGMTRHLVNSYMMSH